MLAGISELWNSFCCFFQLCPKHWKPFKCAKRLFILFVMKRPNPEKSIISAGTQTDCHVFFVFLFLHIFCFPKRRILLDALHKRQLRQGNWGVIPMPPPCTRTPLDLVHPPTYPTGPNKSVPQMTLLMPLAEIPLFYPWTCGGKAEQDEERKHRQSRARGEEEKKEKKSHFFIWPEKKHLSFYVLAEVKSTWG